MTKILIIYTGGTIGMVNDPKTGTLIPFDFDKFKKMFPSWLDWIIIYQFIHLIQYSIHLIWIL